MTGARSRSSARYLRDDQPDVLRENSQFVRVDGRWRYVGPA